ncbi:MAG: hypothetical protein M1820_007391 [Bogoriella megaspora]|nr:MAG: hypothetical protein M1820_007391 [Bogoriella megaspora]
MPTSFSDPPSVLSHHTHRSRRTANTARSRNPTGAATTSSQLSIRPKTPSRPSKRLIVAADGTWLDSDSGHLQGSLKIPSNITRLTRALKVTSDEGIPQVIKYHYGVGSQGGVVDKVVGGATGSGLSENVRECYEFLCNNWTRGDEIFLLGFSRGAFTARSVGGLIAQIGILSKEGLDYLPEIYRDVLHARDRDYRPKHPDVPFEDKPSAADPEYREELERLRLATLDVKVKAIGVFETVGSLGTPRIGWLEKAGIQTAQSKRQAFHDTRIDDCIENAFQALALDERRSAFQPAVWEKPPGNNTTLRQVWFPGVHANVGGGYSDQELANITLAWMLSQLSPFLDFNTDYIFDQHETNIDYYTSARKKIRPWSFGKIYDSMKGAYAVGGATVRTPGRYMYIDPNNGRKTDEPLRDTHEYVHPSVRSRLLLHGPGTEDEGRYECKALEDWRLVVEPPAQGKKGPAVYWRLSTRSLREKIKGKEVKPPEVSTRILPESPLWDLERELLSYDTRTFEFVTDPPPQVEPTRRRRVSRREEVVDRRVSSRGSKMSARPRSRSGSRAKD